MPVSRLDIIYRRILLSKFFTKGWGDPEHMIRLLKFRKIISTRDLCFNLVDKDHRIEILKEETWSDCYVTEGRFKSPFAIQLPEVVHPEVENAYFQMVLPKKWKTEPYRPVCIHLAGTGDHFFWKRRQIMVKPLLKHGIGSIILENPFYGYRKPKNQLRSCLLNVSDIFVMGGCLILECIALLHFCERLGFGPLGVTGLSMGGHMASLAATSWPKPLVLVPCLSWTTASSVFTEGIMSEAIDWDYLQNQFFSNKQYYDTLSKLCKIVDDPCEFGLARIPGFALTVMSIQDKYKKCANRNLTPHEIMSLISDNSAAAAAAAAAAAENVSGGATATIQTPAATVTGVLRRAVGSSFTRSLLTSLMKESQSMKIRDQDAIWFMRGLMDECTHLKNFAVPVDTSLIIALCARCDAYVPRDGCTTLEDIWPGATIRYLETGHVGAYLRYLDVFRSSIIEAFDKAMKVCPPPERPSPIH